MMRTPMVPPGFHEALHTLDFPFANICFTSLAFRKYPRATRPGANAAPHATHALLIAAQHSSSPAEGPSGCGAEGVLLLGADGCSRGPHLRHLRAPSRHPQGLRARAAQRAAPLAVPAGDGAWSDVPARWRLAWGARAVQ